jgi:nucleotide-binding universal stress UspA family protein
VTEGAVSRRLIIAAVDGSPHSLVALEAAAQVASQLNARLRAMFVEDIDLLRTAELPFSRVVASSGESRPLTLEDLERQLRRLEEAARKAVEAAGARFRLSWSFDVVRGAVVSEIARAGAEADMITVGRAGWSGRGRARLGSVTRALLDYCPSPVLLVEMQDGLEGPVAVLYDRGEAARHALDLALDMIRGRPSPLTVLLLGEDQAGARREVQQHLREAGMPENSWTLRDETLQGLPEALRKIRAKVVFAPQSAAGILDTLRCSAVVVR